VAPDAVSAHYARQQLLLATTLLAARRVWALLLAGRDFDDTWRLAGPRMLALLATAQLAAARDGADYVPLSLLELGLTAEPAGAVTAAAFAGVASDGRQLASLLYEPVIRAKVAVAGGLTAQDALQLGQSALDRIVLTQVADAARAAAGAAVVARPAVTGWVRMVNLPACSRCVVLAGRFYRWNEGFDRHPRCDCRHIPATEAVAGDVRTDPAKAIASGQVTDLTAAARRALDDGADVGQVVNARRGMYTASGGQLRTREAAGRIPRLMPEAIYQLAGDDRTRAIGLLREHGYLT
jgi:hypothetical protein